MDFDIYCMYANYVRMLSRAIEMSDEQIKDILIGTTPGKVVYKNNDYSINISDNKQHAFIDLPFPENKRTEWYLEISKGGDNHLVCYKKGLETMLRIYIVKYSRVMSAFTFNRISELYDLRVYRYEGASLDRFIEGMTSKLEGEMKDKIVELCSAFIIKRSVERSRW